MTAMPASKYALPPEAVIFALQVGADGSTRRIAPEHIAAWSANDGELLWLHLQRGVAGIEEWLREGMGLSDAAMEAVTSAGRRPRSLRRGNALTAVLRGLSTTDLDHTQELATLQMWADGTHIVTLRNRPLGVPQQVLEQVVDSDANPSIGDVVTWLIDALVDGIGESILVMNEKIDALEAADDDDGDVEETLAAIADIRRRCLAVKRHMAPQQDALARIARDAPPWMNDANRAVIRESIDQVHRYLEDIDVTKESALVLQDEINNRVAAQTNKASYLLGIVAAIFLPLGFITGLFGMNLGGMPGSDYKPAFWIACAAMTVLVAAQMVVFRKLKWL